MADQQPFAGLGQEETGSMLLHVLQAILDNLPMRNPTNDTLPVSGTVNVGGNLTGVTTVSTVTNMSQVGALPANTTVFDLMNAAAAPLYDLMVVT